MYWLGCHFLFCDFPGGSCPIIEIKEFLLFAETENRGQRGLTWLFEPIPSNLLTRQSSWTGIYSYNIVLCETAVTNTVISCNLLTYFIKVLLTWPDFSQKSKQVLQEVAVCRGLIQGCFLPSFLKQFRSQSFLSIGLININFNLELTRTTHCVSHLNVKRFNLILIQICPLNRKKKK